MTQANLSRRGMLIGSAALLAVLPSLSMARPAGLSMHVLKDPNCGCCSAWIEILESDGFVVTTQATRNAELVRFKYENGIPPMMVSCHTGQIEGYLIEGHVPTADIRRLLQERPDAVGLAVPGMPYGSPGMGPENQREAYDVFLVRKDGSTELFTRYEAA